MKTANELRILDASAVLAHLQGESGWDVVEEAMDEGECYLTTVNACEVLTKLCEKGMPPAEARASLDDLKLAVVDFDLELATLAASLRAKTRPIGASLGDRACLALAQRAATASSDSPPAVSVLTGEQAWAGIKWPFAIVQIR